MKRMLAIAAFLFASSTAHAQYEFQYGGRTIRIDPDRGTVSIPGVYDNTGRKKRSHDTVRKQSPQEAKVDPHSPRPAGQSETTPAPATPEAPAPAPVAAAPAQSAPATTVTTPPSSSSTTTTTVAPTDSAVQPATPAPSSLPAEQTVAPPPPPSPAVAAVPAAPAEAAPAAPPPAALRDPNSPVGVWLTEEKEGKVRIEQCGSNLCGYSVDTKTNRNGEQVLINMKPSKELRWTGRIHDPNTGSNYDSSIALKGDTLRVQGCAFGGMFCGGQTWTRVN